MFERFDEILEAVCMELGSDVCWVCGWAFDEVEERIAVEFGEEVLGSRDYLDWMRDLMESL